MANQCPDNSTECLLHAILDATSGYNWDPVNFGFTAVFTLIAFVVSAVALVQTFVAAGPGRLKASERAIGPKQHRLRTDTQFSWKEFRFRTIVNVPVIENAKILQDVPAAIPIDVTGPIINKQKTVISSATATRNRARIVAGWSQVLRDFSLTDIDFDTIECLTDYLPSDIPAAPAWARVETITLLCIMKGCTRLTVNEDGFISAVGPSAQLAWNMHPSLGPMAVYRTWDLQEAHLHALHDVQRMIPVFLGELYLAGHKLFKPLPRRHSETPVYFDFGLWKSWCKPSWEYCQHTHDHCLTRKRGMWAQYLGNKSQEGAMDRKIASLCCALLADRPVSAKAYPVRELQTQSAVKMLYEEYFPWLILADDLDDQILKRLCGDDFLEFDGGDVTVDAISNDSARLISWLPYACEPLSAKAGEFPAFSRPSVHLPEQTMYRKWGKIDTPDPSITDEKLTSSRLRISRTAVRHLSRWISDDTYFETASMGEIVAAQRWLRFQLAEVDWFLSSQGADAVCAASNLVVLGIAKFGSFRYTTLSRRFVMPETLDAFNLTWTVSPDDKTSIVVRGYLDHDTIHQLYSYTRKYIDKNRHNLHTVKCPQVAQGYYYASNNERPHEASEPTDPPTSNAGDLNTTMGDTRSTGQALDTDQKRKSTTNAAKAEPESKAFNEGVPTTQVSTSSTNSSDTIGDPTFRELFLEERRGEERRRSTSGEDEVPVQIDQTVAALEALVFFRAGLFAAFLATGTDTSVLLNSDKRFQLVQVQ